MADMKVGIGHPDDPYKDQLLTVEEEQSIDDKGRRVVNGLVWSKAKTGLYLVICLSHGDIKSKNKVIGRTNINLGVSDYILGVMTSYGKPSFNKPHVGACLELPSDLGKDELKKKYITEWITNTTEECFGISKINVKKESTYHTAIAVVDATEKAIVASGL
jgi:hypothetical protein